MFEFIAQILNFFYELVPNYAIAIMLMTLLVMVITTPLTLKGTRSMIKMQLLQPELKKIQEKHKGGDRNEMNQELMAFYQENQLNPLGGCFPLLVQAPVFLILFRLIQGLTSRGEDGFFDPKYLDEGSKLYRDLHGQQEMVSFGLDLSKSTTDALGDSIIQGLPYLFLILVMIGAQYLQQKQVSARGSGAAAMPQQQMLLKVMPAFFGVISIGFPAALVVYWVTSSIYRIGLQGYITHSLYGGEDSLGAQATKAAAEAREMRSKEKDAKDKGAKDKGVKGPTTKPAPAAPTEPSPGSADTGGNGRTTPGKYQPASKKKKRKKR
jgi:YidC/Oxa1 family membrane protein insertase